MSVNTCGVGVGTCELVPWGRGGEITLTNSWGGGGGFCELTPGVGGGGT